MGNFHFPFATAAGFDPSTATLGSTSLTLPPRARFPGAQLSLVQITPSTPRTLFTPVAGTCKSLGAVEGVPHLFELEPLPFPIRSALRACRAGCPTFYLGSSVSLAPADGEFVSAAQPLDTTSSTPPTYWVGVRFQDQLSLEPWAWMRLLDDAMAGAGEAATDPDRANWSTLRTRFTAGGLRLLEANGQPSVRALEARHGAVDWAPLTPDARGGLLLPVTSDPIEVRLAGVPATARPVFSLYLHDLAAAPAVQSTATAADDASPATFTLPAGTRAAYLQVLDLNDWFTARPAIVIPPFSGWTPLGRYHLDSRLEPLVDGNPTFARIVEDLRLAGFADGGAHLAGLSVQDFPLVEGDPTSGIITLSDALNSAGTGVRSLVFKYVNLSDAELTSLKNVVGELGFGLGMALSGGSLIFVSIPQLYRAQNVAVTILLLATTFAAEAVFSGVLGAMSLEDFRGLIESLAEPSKATVARIQGIWSRYPALLTDNPLGDGHLPFDFQSDITHVGAWNQKLQLIRRHTSGTDSTLQHIAYLGSIDLAPSHVDDPGHHGRPFTAPGKHPDWTEHPFHDVQARISGSAVSDLFKTWNERHQFEQSMAAPGTIPAPVIATPPEPGAVALPGGPHIIQVGRTYFRPRAGGTGFPFAPAGENTTHDALMMAISQSRDFIYIEDQYFTPPGEAGQLDTYFGALVAAASTGRPDKKLIILVPSENDQPFGAVRRQHLFAQLRSAWGDRLLVGSPLRRPLLPAPGNYAHEGRCFLLGDLEETALDLQVGPLSRIPNQRPFWLWVEGELMLATGFGDRVVVDEIPGIHVNVLRGSASSDPAMRDSAPMTGADQRAHKKKAPVTLSQLKGIYVHSKVMVVDDVLVAIGSSNLNRRGLFHDGEATSFTIPRALRTAADNPARALRTQLWAEHLGLPPEMGSMLFADPHIGFELFKRSFFEGNRFLPVEFARTRPYATAHASLGGGSLPGQTFQSIIKLSTFALGLTSAIVTDALMDELWRKVIDPTTSADPHPESTIIPSS